MARKKVVLVIVEGPSDDTALGVILNQIYDKDKVHVHIMHGDITTRKGVRSDNIVAKVGDEVRKYAKSNHYTPKHFKQIIHIVDMDGVYIPNENVILDLEHDEISYESDGIHTPDQQGITDAYAFAKKYKNDVEGFVNFICNSDFSVNGDYKESWEYIEDGLNSIDRYTNLGICIVEEIEKGGS